MAIGENWTKVGELPYRRNNHAVLTFDSKIWVIGGQNPDNTIVNDVFSSEDGINWSYLNSHTSFNLPNIGYASPFVLGNTMFIAGGFTNAVVDTIWASKNGIVWVKVGKLPQALIMHGIVVKNDRVYCIGGSPDGLNPLDTVYMSADGIIWNQVGTLPNPLAQHTVSVWNDRLIVIGGFSNGFIMQNKMFHSIDGEYWGTDGGGSSFEVELSPELFDPNKAWLEFEAFGGGGYSEYWEETTPEGKIFDNHAALVYNDELYVFGGRLGGLTGFVSKKVFKTPNPTYRYMPDSTAGIFDEVGSEALPYDHLGRNFVVFNDAFYQVGGWTGDNNFGAVHDVYRSA